MWIVATLLGILLFLIILLAIPFDLAFYGEKEEAFRSRVRVKWLFGLIGKNIGGSEKKSKPKKKKKRRRSLQAFLEMWKARGSLPRLLRFIKDAFRLLKIRNLIIHLRIGLDDPADTGLFFAAAGPTMVFLNMFPLVDIHIEPDFERESLRGHFQGDLRIIPIKLIRPVVLLVFSVTTLQVIKTMVRSRRK